jgi:hypothetical protein
MLPLMGVVPDMKADSNRYILVQNWYLISSPPWSRPSPALPFLLSYNGNVLEGTPADNSYRRKFKADLQNVTERVCRMLSQLGRDGDEISSDEIESFVKNAGYLKVIRYRSLEEEYSSPKTKFIRNPPPFPISISILCL